MCEGIVDSLQNGLAAAISGQYLKTAPLRWTRCVAPCCLCRSDVAGGSGRASFEGMTGHASLVVRAAPDAAAAVHTLQSVRVPPLSLYCCRVCVVVINVPLIIIATRGFEVSIHARHELKLMAACGVCGLSCCPRLA